MGRSVCFYLLRAPGKSSCINASKLDWDGLLLSSWMFSWWGLLTTAIGFAGRASDASFATTGFPVPVTFCEVVDRRGLGAPDTGAFGRISRGPWDICSELLLETSFGVLCLTESWSWNAALDAFWLDWLCDAMLLAGLGRCSLPTCMDTDDWTSWGRAEVDVKLLIPCSLFAVFWAWDKSLALAGLGRCGLSCSCSETVVLGLANLFWAGELVCCNISVSESPVVGWLLFVSGIWKLDRLGHVSALSRIEAVCVSWTLSTWSTFSACRRCK